MKSTALGEVFAVLVDFTAQSRFAPSFNVAQNNIGRCEQINFLLLLLVVLLPLPPPLEIQDICGIYW